MIIDCFTYFNERDLLDVRMNVLREHVDAFILCEANRTFQAAEREYEFGEVYAGRNGMMNVIHADLSCFDGSTTREAAWQREYTQRRRIFDALATMNLRNDAWIILSDIDEIPAPESLASIDAFASNPVAWNQELFYYWVNLRCRHKRRLSMPWWRGSVACQWGTLRNSFHCDLQVLRDSRHGFPDFGSVLGFSAGWHFSFLGGAEAIKAKIRAFAHTEYRGYAEGDQVERALANGWKHNRDVFGRDFMKFELMLNDSHLPAYLVKNKERFKHWWYANAAA